MSQLAGLIAEQIAQAEDGLKVHEIIIGIVGAAAVVVSALVGPLLAKDERNKILKEIEIWNSLPEASTSKAGLLGLIDTRVSKISGSANDRRSAPEVILALVILGLAVFGIWVMVTFGGLWWFTSPVVLFLLLLGGVGLGQGLTKGPRNEKGRLVK